MADAPPPFDAELAIRQYNCMLTQLLGQSPHNPTLPFQTVADFAPVRVKCEVRGAGEVGKSIVRGEWLRGQLAG